MAKQTTQAGKQGVWQRLLAPLADIPAGLGHLVPFRDKLGTILVRVVDLTRQQAGMEADKQEISREIEELMAGGERLASVIRKSIKEHYGPFSEQLTAFGLQPLRGRERHTEPPPPPSEIAAAPAADPEADR